MHKGDTDLFNSALVEQLIELLDILRLGSVGNACKYCK